MEKFSISELYLILNFLDIKTLGELRAMHGEMKRKRKETTETQDILPLEMIEEGNAFDPCQKILVSIGAYEWLTTGGYISSTFFASHCINMYIKNNKTYLKINKKPLWEIGAYIKIDHTPDPISLIIGYSFNQKQKDKAINYSNISNDPRLEGWSMHTIQLMLEYDAAQEDKKTHPRISLVANIPIAGKRIFETTIYGLDAGVEMTWEF